MPVLRPTIVNYRDYQNSIEYISGQLPADDQKISAEHFNSQIIAVLVAHSDSIDAQPVIDDNALIGENIVWSVPRIIEYLTDQATTLQESINATNSTVTGISEIQAVDDVDYDTAQKRLDELKRISGLFSALNIGSINGLQTEIDSLELSLADAGLRTKNTWSGTFDNLGGFDRGRWLVFDDSSYTNAVPAVSERVFKKGKRLESITVVNKGVNDISGLAFYADNTAVSSTSVSLDYRLTGAFSVLAGTSQSFQVVNGWPKNDADMFLAFTCKNIYGLTDVDITFSFVPGDIGVLPSAAQVVRNAQSLALWESSDGPELVSRISSTSVPLVPESPYQRDGGIVITSLSVSQERNIRNYTEELANANYIKSNTTVGDTVKVIVDGRVVNLTRLTPTTFGASLYNTDMVGLIAGTRYIISAYVMQATPGVMPARFWMRPGFTLATKSGHGQRMATSEPRRVWATITAGSSTRIGYPLNPAVDIASQGNYSLFWFADYLYSYLVQPQEIYIGGFQLEKAGAQISGGLIVVGDSTMSGVGDYPAFSDTIRTAGNTDDYRSLEVSRWIEIILNTNVYNRAIGGNDMDEIASRWPTDIRPIATAGNASMIIIQGGINDIRKLKDSGSSDAVVLSTLKARVSALNALAIADGLSPVFLTITPSPSIYGSRNEIRKQYNAWLMSAFGMVIDINKPIESVDGETIIKTNGYFNDGVHYSEKAKEAIGRYIASHRAFWKLPKPSAYMPVIGATAATFTSINVGGTLACSGSGSPAGVIAAPIGSTYSRRDGGAGTSFYVKESGTDSSGWVAK